MIQNVTIFKAEEFGGGVGERKGVGDRFQVASLLLSFSDLQINK